MYHFKINYQMYSNKLATTIWPPALSYIKIIGHILAQFE